MCKIYKQMFNNKIIQIIAVIWLIQQPQLTISTAGHSTLSVITPIRTTVATTQQQLKDIKNMEQHVIKTYDLKSYSRDSNITNASNSTIPTTASNKLNVNNTDAQMTITLKDATAINAYATNYITTFVLEPATEPFNDKNITTNPNRRMQILRNMTALQILKDIPATAEHSQSSTYPTTTSTNSQLSQNSLKSSNTSTQPYLNYKRKSIKTKNTLHLYEYMPKDSQKNVTNAKQTSKKNFIMNINVINKTDLQQQLRKINKTLNPNVSKDIQEMNIKKKADTELIEKGKYFRNEKFIKQEGQKIFMPTQKTAAHKISNSTNLRFKVNVMENYEKIEQGCQKILKLGKEKSQNFKDFRRLNEYRTERKVLNLKDFSTNNLALQKNATQFISSKRQAIDKKEIKSLNEKAQNGKDVPKLDQDKIVKAKLEVLRATFKIEEDKISDERGFEIHIEDDSFGSTEPEVKKLSEKHFPTNEKKLVKINKEEQIENFEKAIESKKHLTSREFIMENSSSKPNKAELKFSQELQETYKEINQLTKQVSKRGYKELMGKSKGDENKEFAKAFTENLQANKENFKQHLENNKSLDLKQERDHELEKLQKPNSNKKNNVRKHFSNGYIHKKEILLNSTFPRQKRLKSNNINTVNPIQLLTIFQNSQEQNSTEMYHNNLSKKKSIPFDSANLKQSNEVKYPPKEDGQSMFNIKKTTNPFRNESVELETENIRKLNFIDDQKKSALNTASGNGNNVMKINSLMNNKQLDGNLNNNSQLVDNGKHVVSEMNTIKGETTTQTPQAHTSTSKTEEEIKTKAYLIADSTVDFVTPTIVTKQYLLEFQTTLATDLTTTPSHTAQPFVINKEELKNTTTTHSITHDLINAKLITDNEETKTIEPTNNSSIKQLVSTTTTTTTAKSTGSAFLHATNMSAFQTQSPSSPTTGTAASTTTTSSWPVKHASVMEGNVILGGLMMVHSREDSITCGPIMPQGGIQALEAMLYTLDQVNKQQLLPNITLGTHILDDCDKDTYGLEMAVDFIKGKSKAVFYSEFILLLDWYD